MKYHVEGSLRLALLSFSTLGLYNIFFIYKNLSVNSGKPHQLEWVIKSILYPLFVFPFLRQAAKEALPKFSNVYAATLTFLCLFFILSEMAGETIGLLQFFTCVPILLINRLFRNANNTNQYFSRVMMISKKELTVIVLGGVSVAFYVIYTLYQTI